MSTHTRALSRTAAALLVAVVTATALGFPRPAAVPRRWELDFNAGPLRLFVDPLDNAPYWYFTYVVTNKTDEDQLWAPNCVLYTDTGEILDSGEGVPSRVQEDLRDLLGNKLLETQNEVIGDLLQGKENARDGLAVWPARDSAVTELTLFIGGISGETSRVKNPVSGEEVILRKTLELNYLVRGDALARGSRPAEFVGKRWVLR